MTSSLFEEDDDLSSVEISSEADSAAERSEQATAILDEIGFVDPDYRRGITDDAVGFVEDMQLRLEECRARRIPLACSERQLAWLEAVREKLGG